MDLRNFLPWPDFKKFSRFRASVMFSKVSL